MFICILSLVVVRWACLVVVLVDDARTFVAVWNIEYNYRSMSQLFFFSFSLSRMHAPLSSLAHT